MKRALLDFLIKTKNKIGKNSKRSKSPKRIKVDYCAKSRKDGPPYAD